MLNLSDSLKNVILDIYIIAPFLFALVLGCFAILKNPVYLRRISTFFSFIQFCFASLMYLSIYQTKFFILNISFNYDKFSSILVFLTAFIFFIASIISKTFILKSHKAFYSVLFLIFGLVNTTVLSDNILICFLNIIWIIFLGYFLNVLYSTKEAKKNINSSLKADVTVIGASSVLILFDFLRYFVLNDIEFSFSNILDNLYHINSLSSLLGFFGFLILVLKLSNLIPFVSNNISNSSKINPLVNYINIFVNYLLAGFLFYKTSLVFGYFLEDFQEIIVSYLLFNFIYYLILSLRVDSIYKFLNTFIIVCFLINFFPVFVFKETGLNAYRYSIISIIVSFSLFYFVLALLSNKFKTDKFEDFKKISSKNHRVIFFIIFSILNMIGVPLLTVFVSRFLIFSTLFREELNGFILNLSPYILLFGCFVMALILLRVFNFILIEPVDNDKNTLVFSKHQTLILILLCFCILIMGLYPMIR